jgi:hypothetical protein
MLNIHLTGSSGRRPSVPPQRYRHRLGLGFHLGIDLLTSWARTGQIRRTSEMIQIV